MATEFISNSWLMPENSNQDRVSNYSLSFDGSSQYIDCGAISSIPSATELSISFWANTDSTSQNQVVFGDNSATPIFSFEYWGSANRMYFEYGTSGLYAYLTLTDVVTAGSWHNVVLVYNASGASDTDKIKFYIDGVDKSSSMTYVGTIPASLSASIGDFWIGNGQKYNSPFNGKITEVSIFDYALTEPQIRQLYGTGSAVGNPMAITNGRKPVAYYPLGNSAFNGEFLASNGALQDYVFNFDGSNDFINCGNAFNQTGAFSVSAWIKTSTSSATPVLFKSGVFQFGKDNWYNGGVANAPHISLTDSGGITKNMRGNKLVSGVTRTEGTFVDLKDGNWHHIAFTYNGTNQGKYYTDGITDASWAGTLASNSNDLLIGKTTVQYWNGNVSNISIYSLALPATGTESVESLYNYGTPPNIASYSGLQGWWELDASATFDGSNWSIPDASSNSNTGTSNGMTVANLVQSDLIINAPFDSFSLDFDGVNDYILTGSAIDLGTSCSISFWYSGATSGRNGSLVGGRSFSEGGVSSNYQTIFLSAGTYLAFYQSNSSTPKTFIYSSSPMNSSDWFHAVIVRDGANLNLYLNGADTSTSYTDLDATAKTYIRNIATNGENQTGAQTLTGRISNVSLYNSALSAEQVATLYNEGKPFDLNNFAVTPVSWWRLGSVNSSYNSTTSEWTILDEIGTNNGTSANMTQADLVDGVGATGSGTSSGMSSGTNKTGDAPYSNSNSVSYNMSVTAKSTSTPT